MVTRCEDRLSTSVYRKKTHTDRYIHFSSNHHDRVKREVIQCLRSRATRICEAKDLEAEEEHLRMTFRKNGYPRGFITGAMKPREEQEETQRGDETVRKTLCVLPYVKGTSDKLGKYMQESRSTPCVSTDEDIEEPTHKGERATEACGQGSGVPNPLCTV